MGIVEHNMETALWGLGFRVGVWGEAYVLVKGI